MRALGNRQKVAFIQFIKYWGVSEHVFLRDIQPLYKDQLYFYRGGKGFYKAGELSEQHVSETQHLMPPSRPTPRRSKPLPAATTTW